MKLLVLDGNSILNRAFYGIKILTTKDGTFTNGIYGFLNILLKLRDDEAPDETAIAFDLPAPTFRHQMYDGYKARRKGMPEELAGQLPVLKELLAVLGYRLVTAEGYEADDVLGTLSRAAAARGEECLLATGDRDSLQLVEDGVTVLLTTTVYGKGQTTRMDEAAVREKYGVTPPQLIDIKALQGDASDNIPGVPGVGEKTAAKLVQQFGSLDGLYENINDASIKDNLRQKLLDGKDSAYLSRTLGTIDCAAPVDTAVGAYAVGAADKAAAAALLAKLEMFSLMPKFGLDAADAAMDSAGNGGKQAEVSEICAEPLQKLQGGPVYLAPFGDDCFVVAETGGDHKVYRVPGAFAVPGAPRIAMAETESGQFMLGGLDGSAVETGTEFGAENTQGTPKEPENPKETAEYALFLELLQDAAIEKHVFSSKELHRLVMDAAEGGSKAENAAAADAGGLKSDAGVASGRSGASAQRSPGAPAGARNIAFDAKLAAYLLNPAAPDYEVARLANERGVTPKFTCPEFPEAGLLVELFSALRTECEQAEMLELLTEMEQPLAEVLASMELAGVAVDTKGIREFGDMLQKEMAAQLESVYAAVGYAFNLNSPKQLAEALFTKLGLKPGKKTKSGFSTDAKTLETLRGVNPVVDTILQYRTYQKLSSTYVEAILRVVGEDGRVHSTFNQTEARTGRLSSNEPNVQNIPVRTELGSRFRKYFVAEGGHEFADADYSQIELRILASVSGDEAMRESFGQNVDIHRATAARVHNIPLEEVAPHMRTAAKAVNFGIVYGIGAFSLSKDIGVTVKEADEFIKTYLAKFPGVKQYMDDSVRFAEENGYVKTLFGRRRPVPEIASSNANIRALGSRIAMNTPIQGTAADVIKLAMIRVWRRLAEEKLAARLVLQVHDELIVEAPENELAQVEKILREEMEGAAAGRLQVPLVADVHAGKNWLDAKG